MTVVQRGLPKAINQHIAEFWTFKKCKYCKKHYHTDYFRIDCDFFYDAYKETDKCYYCREPWKHWKSFDWEIETMIMGFTDIPDWMDFDRSWDDYDEIFNDGDGEEMDHAKMCIFNFGYEHGIPPSFIPYHRYFVYDGYAWTPERIQGYKWMGLGTYEEFLMYCSP